MQLRTAAIGAGAVLMASLVGVTSASASCNPGRMNDGIHQWVGLDRQPGTSVGGVYSDIWFYAYPYQASGGTVDWGMILNGSSYAQTGYEYRQSDSTHWTFWQWTHDGTYSTGRAQPNGVNGFDYYTTLWNNTPGKFTFKVDSTVLDTQTAQFTPNHAQISSEITTGANQMPGDVSINEEDMDSHIWYNGGWQVFNGSPFNTNINWFGDSEPSGGLTIFSWDKCHS